MLRVEGNQKYLDIEIDNDDLDWLELPSIPEEVVNPLDGYGISGNYTDYASDLVSILSNKDYLHFFCKHILNVELLPYQLVVLDTLWNKKSPMLIGCRGAAKSFMLAVYSLIRMVLTPGIKIVIVGAGLRQARQVFDYMANIWLEAPVLQDVAGSGAGPKREIDRFVFKIGTSVCFAIPLGSGDKIRGLRANIILADEFSCQSAETLIETTTGLKRIGDCANQEISLFTGDQNEKIERPTKFIRTPLVDVYKVKTRNGFTFKCSSIHKTMTANGWKLCKDMTKKDWLIFENNYVFPDKIVEKNGIKVDENLAWLMGMLVSEGSINSKGGMHVHMIDKDCIERINSAWKTLDKDINTTLYERPEHLDRRGWINQKAYVSHVNNNVLREKLSELGLTRAIAHQKKIPWSILESPRNIVLNFLRGLFEGDGTCFNWRDERDRKKLGISYYSVSEQLCSEVQVILAKLDILSHKVSRKSKLSKKLQWMIRIANHDVKKFFDLMKIKKWEGIDKDCYFGRRPKNNYFFDNGKNLWTVNFYHCGKAIHFGSFLTEQEAIDCVEENRHKFPRAFQVLSVDKLPEKEHLYDFYLPSTHSFYGGGFRQHNSIPEEIFNIVVRGFASVQNEPTRKVKQAARMRRLRKKDEYSEGMDEDYGFGRNQIIISGTATPAYNHFAKYFNIWQSIILSKGDQKYARELFGNDKDALKGFNWRDYAIIRIPYTHLPEGLLDPAMLAQAKATVTVGQFNSEYGACFISDSDGFFKGSLLESATVTKPIEINGQKIQFTAQRQGVYGKRYIMGVDPAADQDNAAIVILEINPDHRKIVYCWTINKKKHTEIKKKFTIAENYYEYLAFKIKHLMQSFYIDWIIMDKNGGGRAIAESLKKKISDSDQPVYDVINPDEPKVEDEQEGLHILHLLSPTADINAEANHGMKKDFETKTLLFPLFDSVELAKSYEMDSMEKEVHIDTYEDLLYEIEDMKKELRSIVVTPSANLGKETFDTPSHTVGGKKGRTKKDRYSALLYANYLARTLDNQNVKPKEYETVGGTMQQYKYSKITREEPMYFGLGVSSLQGNSWIAGVSNNHIRR